MGKRDRPLGSGGRRPSAPGASAPDHVELGPGAVIDDNVRLGYTRATGKDAAPLRIGANAHVRSGSVIYAGSRIGRGVVTGHNVVIKEDASIGDDCLLSDNTVVECGCAIGRRVHIQANCHIGEFTTIEDDVFVGSGTAMGSDPYPGSDAPVRGPTVKRGAQIGANATLLPSVVVGEAAFIEAGSVVTHDIVAGTLAVGNPARVISLDVAGVGGVALPRVGQQG